MELYELPKNIQNEVVKLAQEHTTTMEEALEYYLMGGEYADTLCTLRDLGYPYSYIKIQNDTYWKKKNKLNTNERR